MEKTFKMILGIFMLCSLLIPLRDSLKNFNFSDKKSENFIENKDKLKSTTDEQMKIIAQKNLKTIIEEFLKEKNIKPEKINIIMDRGEDNCISIKNVEVFLLRGDENKKDIVKNELEKKLKLKIDVVGSE